MVKMIFRFIVLTVVVGQVIFTSAYMEQPSDESPEKDTDEKEVKEVVVIRSPKKLLESYVRQFEPVHKRNRTFVDTPLNEIRKPTHFPHAVTPVKIKSKFRRRVQKIINRAVFKKHYLQKELTKPEDQKKEERLSIERKVKNIEESKTDPPNKKKHKKDTKDKRKYRNPMPFQKMNKMSKRTSEKSRSHVKKSSKDTEEPRDYDVGRIHTKKYW